MSPVCDLMLTKFRLEQTQRLTSEVNEKLLIEILAVQAAIDRAKAASTDKAPSLSCRKPKVRRKSP